MTDETPKPERDVADLIGSREWLEPMASVDLTAIERLAARRKHRMNLVAVAAAAAVAIIGVGAAVVIPDLGRDTVGPAASSGDAVPWVETPGAVPSDSNPGPCSATNLRTSLGSTGAWHGQAIQNVDLANTAVQPCSLALSRLSLSVTTARNNTSVSQGNLKPNAVTIPAASAAHVAVGAPASCNTPVIAKVLVVRLDGGPSQTLDGAWVPVSCGLPSVVMVNIDEVDQPDIAPGVTAVLDTPASALAGTTLQFTVTLTNTSSAAVSFASCPSYRVSLKSSQVSQTYELNCQVDPDLGAGASRTYAMELGIPISASGSDDLSWSLLGTNAHDSATLTIG